MRRYMAFEWFWDRVGCKWLLGVRAAVAFGASAFMVCLITAYLLGGVRVPQSGAIANAALNTLGVVGVFSVMFLWIGMLKVLEIDERLRGTRSKLIRALLFLGAWYGATVYYVIVYLPIRNKLLKSGAEA